MSAEDTPILQSLFRPKSVAVVGASGDPTKTGGRPIAYLQKYAFPGRIYPVNPKLAEIAGLKAYADVRDLPEAPELGIVLLGADRAHLAVSGLAERGAKVAIVLASGFGEAGCEGIKRQKQLREAAGGMRLLGPNTIGAINLNDNIMLSATGALEMENLFAGHISVASQSGGILGSLLSRGAARGVGFSKLASTGNEADIDIGELIECYAVDPQTRVIAAYIEGIRDLDQFRRAAQLARQNGKPIVAFKVGRSESGARSAVSHTGAMAGEDRLYDALFRQLGIVRAETFNDLLDLSAMFAADRQMHGKRVGILTSTGGAGSLVADSCGLRGLEVPLLDIGTATRIAELLGEREASTNNPVDVTLAGATPGIMVSATRELLGAPDIDAVVVVVGSSALARPQITVDAIIEGAADSEKPVVAYLSPDSPEILRLLNRNAIPAFTSPEACAAALNAVRVRPAPAPASKPELPDGKVPGGLPPGSLNEAEAYRLFRAFGVRCADSEIVHDVDSAKSAARAFGGPVVLKMLSRTVHHKSDVGGVRVNLAADEVGAALEEMREDLATHGVTDIEGFLVQKMLGGGVEMILGFRRDDFLGPVILLGAGGVAAELFNDTAVRLLPITEEDARDMVAELRFYEMLKGFRGKAPHDVDALVAAVMAFSRMISALGDQLVEAEINPLLAMSAGAGVVALDGLVVLREKTAKSES